MVKKTCKMLLISIIITGIIMTVGCQSKKENNTDNQDNFKMKKLTEGLMNLADNAISTKTGYYNLHRTGTGCNILYTDYENATTIFLCAQPNCTHIDDTCNSYLDTPGLLFAGYEKQEIYFLSNNYSEIGGYPHSLYRMDINGENKTKVYTFESYENYTGNHIFASKNNIYFTVNSGKEKAKVLQCVDINTGKSKQLMTFKGGETFMGCFENYIYTIKTKGFDLNATDNGAGYSIYGYNVAEQSYTKILDIEQEQENSQTADPLFSSQDFIIIDNYLYVYNYNTAKMTRTNLKNQEKEDIVILPEELKGVSSVYWQGYNNDILILNYAANKRIFNIDISKKTFTETKLTMSGSKGDLQRHPLTPLLINDEILLFYNGSIPYQYKTFLEDGTAVVNDSSFGVLNMISRDDYLNNVENYQIVSNIEVKDIIMGKHK